MSVNDPSSHNPLFHGSIVARQDSDLRESLDERVLVGNLPTGLDVLLLGFFEFLGRSVFFEGYLVDELVCGRGAC